MRDLLPNSAVVEFSIFWTFLDFMATTVPSARFIEVNVGKTTQPNFPAYYRLSEQTHAQENTSVLVSNIAGSATEVSLAEFFSFCGKIEKIQFLSAVSTVQDDEESRKAVITFATTDAAHTALLLSNAHIIDRAIVVKAYVTPKNAPDAAASSQSNEQHGKEAPPQSFSLPVPGQTPHVVTITEADEAYLQRNYGCVPDSMRSKTSVVASLIAAGYVLGEDIVQKAREFDAQNSVLDRVKAKAQQLEEEYRVSGRLKELGDRVTEAVKSVDDSIKFSETVEKVIAHPTVNSGLTQLKTMGTTIGEAMKTTLDAQIREVELAIEERHAARAHSQNANAIEGENDQEGQSQEMTEIKPAEEAPEESPAVQPLLSPEPTPTD